MKCASHPRKEAAGYCFVCGAFGCDDCLNLHEGNTYCKKHYRPFAEKIEQDRKHQAVRKRHGRHHLVIRYKDGRTEYGICLVMNVNDSGFHLEKTDERGVTINETTRIRFKDLKAVFNVKSFDGHFDKSQRYQEYTPGGSEVVVRFMDGETIRGNSLKSYDPDDARFYLIPEDADSNNISILVEGSAVEGVYSPEEYDALPKEEAKPAQAEPKHDATQTSQEETMGEFYFETHGYPAALEQYQLAAKQNPDSARLRRKIVVSTINIGIQHIKKRRYPDALRCMESALQYDPNHVHAKKKAEQLREVIEKTERRMRRYQRQKAAGSGDKPA